MTVKRGLVNLDYTQDKDPGWSGIDPVLGIGRETSYCVKGRRGCRIYDSATS